MKFTRPQKYIKCLNFEVKIICKYHTCIYFCTKYKSLSNFYDRRKFYKAI